MLEDLVLQIALGLERNVARRLQLGQHAVIIRRIDNDHHILRVFGRRAKHGRAADVDVLNRFIEGHAGLFDGRAEGIQVDDDHIDRLHAELLQLLHVFGIITHGKQTRVNRRVQRLHAPIKAFRETGHVAHAGDGNPRLLNRLHRAAGGEQGHALIRQTASQFHNAGLIRHAQNRTLNHEKLPSLRGFAP